MPKTEFDAIVPVEQKTVKRVAREQGVLFVTQCLQEAKAPTATLAKCVFDHFIDWVIDRITGRLSA